MVAPVATRLPDVKLADPVREAEELGAAFRAFFDAHLPYVWSSLGRLGVPDRDREDLAHEVFFRAHRRFADFDASRPARPWLFAFAVRVAAEHRRLARNRYEQVGASEDVASMAVATGAPGSDARQTVYAALAQMDLERRAVFILHFLDGFSIAEMARALETPEGTLYSRLRAAREQFTAAVRRIQRRDP
jgi:RNA polymerase sigma-70 factor (ECF subfamily)